jgi:hypothetical protein
MADDNTKLTRQELENKEKLEDINERREKGLINEREHLREVLALGERQITQATERLKVEEKRASLLDSDIDKRTRKIALEERSAKLALEALEAAGASDDELRKQLQTLEQIRKEQDRINSAYSASVGLAESIATKLGLSANFQNSFLGSAMSTKSGMEGMTETAGNLITNVKDTAGAFGGIVKSGAAAGALIEKFVEVTALAVVEADKLRAQFTAVTGEAGGTRDQFINLTLANTDLAISMEAMMGTQLALREEFAGFVNQSEATVRSMTLHAATLEKLGVDASTTAAIYNDLSHALGMNQGEMEATSRELVGLAQATGRSTATIAAEFQAALPRLAMFGDEATDVFKGLQDQAMQTGVSVQELTNIFGAQMDTFEGTARIAGRLNAVMGTDLVSSTELLNATDDERVQILRERLQLAGMDFENMDRFQQMAIANAAGIQDVATASKLFGDSQAEVAMTIGDTNISTAEMEQLAKDATDSFTKLKFAVMQMAVAVQPLVEGFASLVATFVEFSAGVPGGMGGLLSFLTGIAGVLTLFVPGGQVAGAAMIAAAATGGAAMAMAPPVDDAVISGGTVTPINSRDDVVAAKPGGPIDQMGGLGGGGSDTTLVVKVMLNEREMGEAIVPFIDRRVLGDV